jgi:L-ascorbate metabolism protein UlaG (beta-lactamase superfamily)
MRSLWRIAPLLLAVVGIAIAAEEPSQVTIDWYGQACMLITTPEGARILIDPVSIGDYRVPETVIPDLITVSHNHGDHNAVGTVGGNAPVLYGKTREEIDPEQKFIPIDTTIAGVKIYNVSSQHHPPDESPTLNAIFVYEFDGFRIVHLGDLGTTLTTEQIEKIGAVDILMIPVGGKYTIYGATADSVVAQLRPTRAVIPMHFRTRVADFLPYSGADFVAGKENVERIAGHEYCFDPSEPATGLKYILFEQYD